MTPLAKPKVQSDPQALLGPSQAAHVLARLIGNLPSSTRKELATMLGAHLGVPSVYALRHYRLGLLAELIIEARTSIPIAAYDEELARRTAQGERWPSSSLVAKTYGGWPKACIAAARFAGVTPQRVPATTAARRDLPSFTMEQIIEVIISGRRELGDFPTEEEYLDLAFLRRLLAGSGKDAQVPRIPGRKAYRSRFETYDRAVDAARRVWERQEQMRAEYNDGTRGRVGTTRRSETEVQGKPAHDPLRHPGTRTGISHA